jgi:hypothetical protein
MESEGLTRTVNSASARSSAGRSRKRATIPANAGDGGVGAGAFADAVWQKSSWSSYNGNCVAVGQRVGVRDTKKEGLGEVLVFDDAVWRLFVNSVKSGSQIR